MAKSIYFLLLLAPLLVCGGCGGSSDLPTLYPVTGTVTLDGQPLAGAMVTFAPSGKGSSSSGTTNGEGKYELTYSRDNKGAVEGLHSVTIVLGEGGEIEYPDGIDPDNLTEEQVAKYAAKQKNLPARYNTDGELEATVSGDKVVHDFQLTSGGDSGGGGGTPDGVNY